MKVRCERIWLIVFFGNLEEHCESYGRNLLVWVRTLPDGGLLCVTFLLDESADLIIIFYFVVAGPFKEPVSVVMKLSNNVDKKVCFKVKTTAPKRYCVKPTTGVIDPKGAVTILVTLQPFDPNDPNEKGKHKFQVLSALAPEGEFNIETLVSFLSSKVLIHF